MVRRSDVMGRDYSPFTDQECIRDQLERAPVDVGLFRLAELRESLVQPGIFTREAFVRRDGGDIDRQLGSALGQLEAARGGPQLDVPALLALLAEVEFRAYLHAILCAHANLRGDGRLLIFR